MSHVWWSDRFTLGLRRLTAFRWYIKMCGCYEFLAQNPGVDGDFYEHAAGIMRLVDGVTYGAPKNLSVFGDPRITRPRAVRRVFNGVSRSLPPDGAAEPPTRNEPDFVFCICSRAIREKGWEEAILAVDSINALPPAQRCGKRAKLWLIGDGPHLQYLKTRYHARKSVAFLGQQFPTHSFMAAADAGLLPSYFAGETQPTMLIEFLASGRPVIATAIGAVPEMLSHDGLTAGLLLPTDEKRVVSLEALAALMLRYMTEPRTYRSHRDAARPVFDAKFDLDVSVGNYLAFFQEVEASRGRRVPVGTAGAVRED